MLLDDLRFVAAAITSHAPSRSLTPGPQPWGAQSSAAGVAKGRARLKWNSEGGPGRENLLLTRGLTPRSESHEGYTYRTAARRTHSRNFFQGFVRDVATRTRARPNGGIF